MLMELSQEEKALLDIFNMSEAARLDGLFGSWTIDSPNNDPTQFKGKSRYYLDDHQWFWGSDIDDGVSCADLSELASKVQTFIDDVFERFMEDDNE